MKIRQIIEKLDDLTEDERVRYLPKVMGHFCEVSLSTILGLQNTIDLENFTRKRDGKEIVSFAEFVTRQNKVIRECYAMEQSQFGELARSAMGLQPLNIEVEV